ncbi:SymE family type I addiction module toxin [Agarilytica rhodophyticola]|uniref:SymE family type I addiction module toxin n=1 Tax=Agarilytica rhodophyticola TaxID=1737490 RepID=UPI000B343113
MYSYSYQLSQSYHQRTPICEIHLKGHWLIKAGFEIDSPVKVRVMEGCLVLTREL